MLIELFLFVSVFVSLKFIFKNYFNQLGFNEKDFINFLGKINSIIHAICIVFVSNAYLTGTNAQENFFKSSRYHASLFNL